jgi:threonine dehydrogenase-like Zn-dependent dehydrogenase
MKAIYFDLKMYKAMLKKLHLAGRYAMLKYRQDWPIPELDYPNQVQVKTKLCGICGTDMHLIGLEISFAASILASRRNPFPMGHEFIGEVSGLGQGNGGLREGDRVVYVPLATCETYGFKLCEACRRGNLQSCIALAGAGDGTALEKRYGGEGAFGGVGFGGYAEYAVGFEKQFFKLPDSIPDEAAVLIEPLSIGLHAVLRNSPAHSDHVVIIGGGTIGLMTLTAIRALGLGCSVLLIARYPFQAEAAKNLGADETIIESDRERLYERVVESTGGRLFKPLMERRVLFGNTGPDCIFDCVATDHTLDDALRMVRNNGKIVIVGLGFSKTKSTDWSLQALKEVQIVGSENYGIESWNGIKTHAFLIAISLLEKNPKLLNGIVSHSFALEDYRQAFGTLLHKGRNNALKAVFDFRE